jgi:hypothetical protein
MWLDSARSPVSFRSISGFLRPCSWVRCCRGLGRAGWSALRTVSWYTSFFDLMHEATEQTGARDVTSWLVFLGSLGVSFVGLVALESSQVFGGRSGNRMLSLPYMIAVGMGLHNLGEGLAIGASYASGEYTLSALLVAGFGLHNGTEGFGIVGAAGKTPISWRDVFLLGLIAGLPTCVGTFLSGQGCVSLLLHLLLFAGSRLVALCGALADGHVVHGDASCAGCSGHVCRYQSHVCHGDGVSIGQRRSQLTARAIHNVFPLPFYSRSPSVMFVLFTVHLRGQTAGQPRTPRRCFN